MNQLILDKPLPPLEQRNNKLFENSEKTLYKKIDGIELSVYIFKPNTNDNKLHPGIFFFNGGNWDVNVNTQFAPHCHHFANEGFVSGIVEYRVNKSIRVNNYTSEQAKKYTPVDSMLDARTFANWINYNANSLNLNTDKIVLSGASSGAHLALSTVFNNIEDISKDSTSDNSQNNGIVPSAFVLFEPITDTTKKGIGESFFPDKSIAKKSSPIHNIIPKEMPPTIIMHGTNDRNIPFDQSYRYAKAMKRKKNRCDLKEFEGRDSGFFNFNVNFQLFEITLNQIDNFLSEIGILDKNEYDNIKFV